MIALITGASSGIGRDMAREMARLGYDLVLVARNEKNLKKLKEELQEKNNIKIQIIMLDLSVKENCYYLYDKVKDIDVLINNAGFGLFGQFENTNLEKEISMINTNIVAYHILMKLYLKDMIKKNKGHILNVASIAGFMPGPLMSTYYATKNYIVSLTRAVHKELKKKKSNVNISMLCPGPIDTNFNNVANVQFKIPGLSSEKVASITIRNMLKGKFIIIPGLLIKLTRIFCEIIPDFFTEKICYHMQIRKSKFNV